MAEEKKNNMKEIIIEKVTVNIGTGEAGQALLNAQEIVEELTGTKTVQTKCRIRQPKWGIRPGLPIGLKTTLRDEKAVEFLGKALKAKENKLRIKNFDRQGNFGFGIKEHIDIPGVKYDPQLGITGLDVLVTLKRKGYRVRKRKIRPNKVGKSHIITKQEAIDFIKENYKVEIA